MSVDFFKSRRPIRHVLPRIPEDMRLYVVGDIHGRDDLLGHLADSISNDLVNFAHQHVFTIFLGDYIDRGPGSANVIERLANSDFSTRLVALRGNHEQVMLQFLEDENQMSDWKNFGGLTTLASYGVNISELLRGRGYKQVQQELIEKIPPAHLSFLKGTQSRLAVGDYFFCHAGVRPGIALARQSEQDLLWIRDEFLNWTKPFEKIIVHGHTPVVAPDIRSNRINIDTGAYATDRLTCLVLQGTEQRFL
jgi:serine/threonine protein phosphatase 1